MTFFKFFSLKLLDFDQPFFVLFILFGRTVSLGLFILIFASLKLVLDSDFFSLEIT